MWGESTSPTTISSMNATLAMLQIRAIQRIMTTLDSIIKPFMEITPITWLSGLPL